MSKTINKLGKPSYTLRLTVDPNPVPTPKMKSTWAEWDRLCYKDFNMPYDALSDKQKTQFHFNMNTGVYKNE